ncbi:MAG: ribbon-helix-helix protein, CopG family, partial [Rhodothermia bacterium]
YGYHIPYIIMNAMNTHDERRVAKTTVYLDVGDYQRIKGIARAEGRSAAELVREAVTEYARRHGNRLLPRSLGAGRSRRGDLADRAEDLLDGLGQDG